MKQKLRWTEQEPKLRGQAKEYVAGPFRIISRVQLPGDTGTSRTVYILLFRGNRIASGKSLQAAKNCADNYTEEILKNIQG